MIRKKCKQKIDRYDCVSGHEKGVSGVYASPETPFCAKREIR